jgi:hypothetical protein
MLQSDWTRNDESAVLPSVSGSQKSSNSTTLATNETGELTALLSELSPNKRAVIETLLGAWGIHPHSYLEQTG